MKYPKIAMLCLGLALTSCSSHGSSEESGIKNGLRAPAYPLITIDPYTSAWSMSDNLYDSSVKHWTGKAFPLLGVVKVDGIAYRFLGEEMPELMTLVSTSEQDEWSAAYTTTVPMGDWTALDYDDSGWMHDKGAFGTMENEPTAKTQWGTPSIWVRRTIELPENLDDRAIVLEFSNDDDAIFYVNGVQAHSTGNFCYKNQQVYLPEEARSALKPGKNVIAAICNNPVGNGLLDFGLKTPVNPDLAFSQTAVQTSVDVQPTQTHYKFTCGSVDLALTFTAPMFMEDLDLLSRPVNYVTYAVESNDDNPHDIEFYFEASPQWALNSTAQESKAEGYEQDQLFFLKAGSTEQDILGKVGDHIRIDWGHFYMASPKEDGVTFAVGAADELRKSFLNGSLTNGQPSETASGLAFARKMRGIKHASNMLMIGYDDIYSIQYFGENLRPYWNRKGEESIEHQFELACAEYPKLMEECQKFDRDFMQKFSKVGGNEYADLCALAYRQTLAAHKLVEAPNGDLLLMSKENDSNGSIGTVDITYPTAPFFLYYKPELAEALMNHIFYYTESGKWDKDFPAHDVGTYPKANGQTYNGDMPVEEGGNMLILTAAIAQQEGHAEYAQKHWDALTTWTDYLVQYGLDPEHQLCTDDFAGHFAHNANLSIKAILGIAAYAQLADSLGMAPVAQKYRDIAKDYATKWQKMACDGNHYALTFDKKGTWSQKYNLVWDRLLGLDIFDPGIINDEIQFYLKNQNEYGLPLDSRKSYTKSDWIMWTATMANDDTTFRALIKPIYKFYNETEDRVPMSDWIYTDRPNRTGFMTRSVVGGYWIKMLDNKIHAAG